MSDLKKVLEEAAKKVDACIRLDKFPESVEPLELREAVKAYPCIGGKRLRPVLLMWTYGMLGGDPDKVVSAASAVEIYHNWTLVHDDIIDRDDTRRGVPTSHVTLGKYAEQNFRVSKSDAVKFGSDMAILAGDVQQAWAMAMMLSLGSQGFDPAVVNAAALRMQTQLNCELISGEALDVEQALRDGRTVTKDQVMKMMSGKTSAILRYAVQTGAALALNTPSYSGKEFDSLALFAENLGLAFQLKDDLLGVFGDYAKFGKMICSDFQESKVTILYLEAVERLGEEKRKELDSLMGLPEYGEKEISKIRELLTECGAAKAVEELVKCLSKAAIDVLDAMPENKYRNLLKDLTASLLDRAV